MKAVYIQAELVKPSAVGDYGIVQIRTRNGLAWPVVPMGSILDAPEKRPEPVEWR